MRDADTAMYHAKSRGKARHEVFDADMHARVRDRLSLENDLRRAIAANDFEVRLPADRVADLGDVRRLRVAGPLDPQRRAGLAGHVHPDRRGARADRAARHVGAAGGVPHVRRTGSGSFPAAGLDCITVNVSSRQLVQQNFPRLVQQAVRQTGLRPADLRVEITETALLDSPGEAAAVLRELRDFGVKVYLDDFGTGYSSLSHLHKLPVDALKIDRSFVNSLLLPGRPAIVESILALARTLNTSVVAEGIESEVQARELERLGCTHAQGYPLLASAVDAGGRGARHGRPSARPERPHRRQRGVSHRASRRRGLDLAGGGRLRDLAHLREKIRDGMPREGREFLVVFLELEELVALRFDLRDGFLAIQPGLRAREPAVRRLDVVHECLHPRGAAPPAARPGRRGSGRGSRPCARPCRSARTVARDALPFDEAQVLVGWCVHGSSSTGSSAAAPLGFRPP